MRTNQPEQDRPDPALAAELERLNPSPKRKSTRMKTARIKVSEFALICPECGDRLTEGDCNTWGECNYPQAKTIACDCGAKVRVPSERRISRLMDREIKR